MEIKQSTIKLQEFNQCDPSEVIEALANTHALPIDLRREYWQNDTETLAVKLPLKNSMDAVSDTVRLTNLYADELDYEFMKDDRGNNVAIFRLWWD